MATSAEPPHKKQRRALSIDRADGESSAGGDADGSAALLVAPPSHPAAGEATEDASFASLITSAAQQGQQISADSNGDGSNDNADGAGITTHEANQYAHILLAQAAESSARMIEQGTAEQEHAPAPSSNEVEHPAHTHEQAHTHTHTHDAFLLGQLPEQEMAAAPAPDTFTGHGLPLARLSHSRLEELDLLLLQISHSHEPRRYGLVCRQCKTAVKPNQLAAHLTRKDAHTNFKAKTKRAMIAKTQVAELVDIIHALLQEVGVNPNDALGGTGSSSLLSFNDFFGPIANSTLPRPALPSLEIKRAAKCQRCFKLVSRTHKKAHRTEDHPDEPKDQVPFEDVRVQELARNGGVLFQIFEEGDAHLHGHGEHELVVDRGLQQHHQQQHHTMEGSGASLAQSAAEQALADHDHRAALSTVLSAITGVTSTENGSDNLNDSTNHHHALIDDSSQTASSAGIAADHLAPPPPAPSAANELESTLQHAGAAVHGGKEPGGVNAHADALADDLTHAADASDPALLSRAAAAAAAAAAAMAEHDARAEAA
ncbi:hypothetical protein OC834_001616 [Tilletia horrida]|uniref:Uncharacterized protein n=1 Tax=Tilletia horrida TaxID=155126 RepID=A0AAN6JKY4_9BASI|nr:hypothetical protein OC842_003673 [Tilletia horrida]KAK0535192.1 hypothetical protein OC834_001616 [Tilletia horrida]KAK0565891.1 hypothetical protein OC844_000999 [Tilletia horrida]